MRAPQSGIFALGTASHAYLEFDASDGDGGHRLVRAIAALRKPRTTMGGINLVAGFRPELWALVAQGDAVAGLHGFNDDEERVIGRTKPDSVELEDRPEDSHVARTDQETFGDVFRRNMP
jgi:porphyrinogen peroxidase